MIVTSIQITIKTKQVKWANYLEQFLIQSRNLTIVNYLSFGFRLAALWSFCCLIALPAAYGEDV